MKTKKPHSISQWYDKYLYNEEMLKEAGIKENILGGLLGALVLVLSGMSIKDVSAKTQIPETEIIQSLQDDEIMQEARKEIEGSRKTVGSETKEISITKNILARTIYAEGRGESTEGKMAIATVIFNRGRGNTQEMVKAIQCPKQFSCWNKASSEDWTNMKQGSGKDWEESLNIAESLVNGSFTAVGTFDHYFNPKKVTKYPSWAKNQLSEQIGNHLFYTLGSWKS